MKNLSTIIFTIAVFCLSAICVSAQQTSLEETLWKATVPPFFTKTYIKAASSYYFRAQNKATLSVSFIDMPPSQTTVDPVTGQWKAQYYSSEIKTVEDKNGTFKRTGNSIRIEFPDYIINATINDNVMSGEMTVKSTNEKIKWIAVKDAPQKESASSKGVTGAEIGGVSSHYEKLLSTAEQKAEQKRLMTEMEEKNRSQSNAGSSETLKIGSYEIFGSESINTGFAGILKQDITFYIKIESIATNGDVKGIIYRTGGDGKLKGKISSNGKLQLQGYYIDNLQHQWNFKLTATVDDGTLTDGNYEGATGSTSYKGTFNVGRFQK